MMSSSNQQRPQPFNSGMRALVVVGIVLAGAVVPSSDKANAATCIALDFDGVGNRTARSAGPVAPMWGTAIWGCHQWAPEYYQVLSVAKASGFVGTSGYSNIAFFVNPKESQTFGTLLSWDEN